MTQTIVQEHSFFGDANQGVEAHTRFTMSRPVQVLARLFELGRAIQPMGWNHDAMLKALPLTERMHALADREETRFEIVKKITNMLDGMVRLRDPEQQARDLEDARTSGVPAAELDNAFSPEVLATSCDGNTVVGFLLSNIDWTSSDRSNPETAKLREFLGSVLAEIVTAPTPLKPTLTHEQIFELIDPLAWEMNMPFKVRARIRRTRIEQLLRTPGEPFTARQEMEIATPKVIADNLPSEALQRLFYVAFQTMGFKTPARASVVPPADGNGRSTHPPPMPTDSPMHTAPSANVPTNGHDLDKVLAGRPSSPDTKSDGNGKPHASSPSHGYMSALEELAAAGFSIPYDNLRNPDAILALRTMLVGQEWPKDAFDTHDALVLFVRTFAHHPLEESRLDSESPAVLEAQFFVALTMMEGRQPLIKKLRDARPNAPGARGSQPPTRISTNPSTLPPPPPLPGNASQRRG